MAKRISKEKQRQANFEKLTAIPMDEIRTNSYIIADPLKESEKSFQESLAAFNIGLKSSRQKDVFRFTEMLQLIHKVLRVKPSCPDCKDLVNTIFANGGVKADRALKDDVLNLLTGKVVNENSIFINRSEYMKGWRAGRFIHTKMGLVTFNDIMEQDSFLSGFVDGRLFEAIIKTQVTGQHVRPDKYPDYVNAYVLHNSTLMLGLNKKAIKEYYEYLKKRNRVTASFKDFRIAIAGQKPNYANKIHISGSKSEIHYFLCMLHNGNATQLPQSLYDRYNQLLTFDKGLLAKKSGGKKGYIEIESCFT